MNAPISLDEAEANALAVADALTGKRALAPGALRAALGLALPKEDDGPSPLLERAAAETFAAGAVRFLLRGGGSVDRTVVRNGGRDRPTGRLWSAALNQREPSAFGSADGRFSLAVSDEPQRFWWRLTTGLLPLAARMKGVGAEQDPRALKRAAERTAPRASATVGDAVVFAMAHENAGGLRLPERVDALVRSGLRKASPLALALRPRLSPRSPAATLAILVDEMARAFECMDEVVVTAWRADAAALFAPDLELDQQVEQARTAARFYTALIAACQQARRTDLLRALRRLLGELPAVWGDAAALRERSMMVGGVRTIADRDRALRALCEVVDLGRALDAVRTELVAQRFHDERYGEAQVTLTFLDERWRADHAGLERMSRALSGAVG